MTDNSESNQLDAIEKKLDDIIAEVERKRSTSVIDFLTAVLLSLATVGSAWCAFQSTLWDGVQTFELMDAHQAGRMSSQRLIEANQKRGLDAILLMQYINAGKEGDIELSDFYFSRFDSTLKKATIEWLKYDPLINQDAPNSPLKMDSYILEEEKDYGIEMDNYQKEMNNANQANINSDRYVMLTVIFAAVLFFGGIAGTLRSNMMRNVSIFLSSLIFILTLVVLLYMPVADIL